MSVNDDYDALRPYASPRQIEYLDALAKTDSMTKAAKAIGIASSVFSRSIRRLKKHAARQGYAPGHWSDGVAPGYVMGKVTIQRPNGDGTYRWERQSPDRENVRAQLEDFAANVCEDVRGMSPIIKPPMFVSQSILATYWFGDPHFGLSSSSEDGGEDTDIDDTDRLTRAGIDTLVGRMPSTQKALLTFIGDNVHANDSSALTPNGRNPLDVDKRGFGASLLSCSRAIVYATIRALTKHGEVEVWILPGNHDPDAAFAISVAVSMYFENNPRVMVKLSKDYLWWFQFGRNLIAAHHGDKIKPVDIHGVLSNDCRAVWGCCDFRYVFQGHIHHDTVTEYQGTRIESLRTLAKQDAWHRGKGYRSMRDTRAVVYHEHYGEAERYTVSAAMLDDLPVAGF